VYLTFKLSNSFLKKDTDTPLKPLSPDAFTAGNGSPLIASFIAAPIELVLKIAAGATFRGITLYCVWSSMEKNVIL